MRTIYNNPETSASFKSTAEFYYNTPGSRGRGRGDGGGGEKSARNFCRRGKRTGAKRCAENELAYLPYFIVNIRERGKGTERNDETDYGEIV